jgi:hypothetical protein
MAVGLMIAAAGAQRQMNRPICAKMLAESWPPVDRSRSGTVATPKRMRTSFLSAACKGFSGVFAVPDGRRSARKYRMSQGK